ncbi:MAG TPA: aminotransferase class V-fold PLP-dependent enzyme [Trueperaceae bacterium]|nr:aminotransferase class V-fold PLP-dependent enzyme [Trueperaceae bacterium]
MKSRLFAPGPVEVPTAVLTALAGPVLHHRSPEFRELFMRVRAGLADVFCTPGEDVVVVTGSGSAAFEGVLLAGVEPGGSVLSLHSGRFGVRWAELARRFGFAVSELATAAGTEYDLDALDRALLAIPDLAAVTVVHSETSTGTLHDVAAVAAAVRARHPDALVLVDAVTSLAAAELRPHDWDLDAVVSGSQKGVMTPPGLSFAWLSRRAWQRGGERVPTTYLDLRSEREKQRDGQTSFTPATSIVAALDVALALIAAEGLEPRWRTKTRLNDALLAGGAALGLAPLARRPSPALAAMLVGDGVAAPDVVEAAKRRGVTIAGGEAELKGRLLRPSLLGWSDRYDLVVLVTALEDALRAVGQSVAYGSGVAAALGSLDAAEARDRPDGQRKRDTGSA